MLSVGYAEAGPPAGPVVLLLHGWPSDIHSYVDVAPRLASAGYRVIVPHLRGHGTTRFLSGDAVRNGQPSAVATDTIALLDALEIDRAIIAGFDWGARTANIVAALWPERCKAMVSVSGYLIGRAASGTTCPRRRPRPLRRRSSTSTASDRYPGTLACRRTVAHSATGSRGFSTSSVKPSASSSSRRPR